MMINQVMNPTQHSTEAISAEQKKKNRTQKCCKLKNLILIKWIV